MSHATSTNKPSPLTVLRALFSRRWWLGTLLALIFVLAFVRLGFWQLDRLDQRRALNAITVQRPTLPAVTLTDGTLPASPDELRFRWGQAAGTFDFEHQIIQPLKKWPGGELFPEWEGDEGSHLITPFLLADGKTAILVDRGWVAEQVLQESPLSAFDEPTLTEVRGVLRLSEPLTQFGGGPSNSLANPQQVWVRLNIEAIQQQMPYPVLPLILQLTPETHPKLRGDYPLPVSPVYNLTEGSHLSYAVQWFSFAVIAAGVYLGYVYSHLKKDEKKPKTG